MKFPLYLTNIRKSSSYLLDKNGINVFSMFGDIGLSGYLKEAAVACFHAYCKADSDNRLSFFSQLIEQIENYAVMEYHWPRDEAEKKIGNVLRGTLLPSGLTVDDVKERLDTEEITGG